MLSADDFVGDHLVRLSDRRFNHLIKVNRVTVGDTLKAGLLNGKTGQAVVSEITDDSIQLSIPSPFSIEPPATLPVHLVIALPRPQMVKRILQSCATMGVKQMTFIHTARVEKSFWQSPVLAEEKIREELVLGLEQGRDTVLPKVNFEKNFKHFVEDQLPALFANSRGLIAHPETHTGVKATACPIAINEKTTLLIGPEGGFIADEVQQMVQAGGECVHLGERILRVETAVTVLLARLFAFK